jgi:hypothetical protein
MSSSVVLLSVIMLSVIMLCVIMLSVITKKCELIYTKIVL